MKVALLPDYDAASQTGYSTLNSLAALDNTEKIQPSLTFAMALDGSTCGGYKDGVEALIQSIYCMLRTERETYIMYPPWYGLEVGDLYGKPAAYIEAMLEVRIKETLMHDDRITDVRDFSFEETTEGITVSYVVYSDFGPVALEGVLYV